MTHNELLSLRFFVTSSEMKMLFRTFLVCLTILQTSEAIMSTEEKLLLVVNGYFMIIPSVWDVYEDIGNCHPELIKFLGGNFNGSSRGWAALNSKFIVSLDLQSEFMCLIVPRSTQLSFCWGEKATQYIFGILLLLFCVLVTHPDVVCLQG
jgi:hypothetical protein